MYALVSFGHKKHLVRFRETSCFVCFGHHKKPVLTLQTRLEMSDFPFKICIFTWPQTLLEIVLHNRVLQGFRVQIVQVWVKSNVLCRTWVRNGSDAWRAGRVLRLPFFSRPHVQKIKDKTLLATHLQKSACIFCMQDSALSYCHCLLRGSVLPFFIYHFYTVPNHLCES